MAKYVLPKFEIGIDSSADFMPEDKKAHIVVTAKYTHGQPMKGIVIVEVFERYECKAILEKTVVINGRETIEFDIKRDLKFNHNQIQNVIQFYKVKATVTENITGLSQTCEMDIRVCSAYVIRTNPDFCMKFKQGSTADVTVCLLLD